LKSQNRAEFKNRFVSGKVC